MRNHRHLTARGVLDRALLGSAVVVTLEVLPELPRPFVVRRREWGSLVDQLSYGDLSSARARFVTAAAERPRASGVPAERPTRSRALQWRGWRVGWRQVVVAL